MTAFTRNSRRSQGRTFKGRWFNLSLTFFLALLLLPAWAIAADTTPPVVTPPADIIIEATGVTTAVTLGVGTANDDVDGTLIPDASFKPFFADEVSLLADIDYFLADLGNVQINAPATLGGSPDGLFSVGVYKVVWSATDSSGNTGAAIQTITVQDTTAPTVTCSDDTVEATGPTTSLTLSCPITEAVALLGTSHTPQGPYSVDAHIITFSATDTSGNIGDDNFILTISDTTAPVVTAPDNLVVEALGPTTAVSLGLGTASDLVDGSMTPAADFAGPYSVGNHNVTWSATDVNNNTGTDIQIISIIDATRPLISLLGNNPASVALNATYTDAGATATDTVDGDVSANIVTGGTVDTNTAGTYTLTYDVQDAQGNAAVRLTRQVIVGSPDTTAPVISLLGDNPAQLAINASYTDAGATALDNVDGDVTANITSSGLPINTSNAGTFFITYNVTDAAGNSAQATRSVMVGSSTDDSLPPVTFNWSNNATGTFTFSQSLPGASVATKSFLYKERSSADGNMITTYYGDSFHGLTMGDFNGDGKTDMLKLYPDSNPDKSWVGLSDGDGTFTFSNSLPGASTATNSYIQHGTAGYDSATGALTDNKPGDRIITGDWNGDGLTDMLHLHPEPVPQYSWVALSNGDGTFTFSQSLPGASAATNSYLDTTNQNIQTGDWNGDGLTDMLHLHPSSDPNDSWVALSDGDGTFTFSKSLPGASTATKSYLTSGDKSIKLGDWNGDGLTDMLHLHPNSPATYSWVALSNGDGTFTFSNSLPYSNSANNAHIHSGDDIIYVGDWNGDGLNDMLNLDPDSDSTKSWVAISKGDGTFIFSQSLPGASEATDSYLTTDDPSINVGDWNGDGLTDMLHLHPDPDPKYSWIAYSNGDGTFAFSNALPGSSKATNSYLLNHTRVNFSQVGSYYGKTIYQGDFNGDGLQDMLRFHPSTDPTESWVALANGSRPDLLASVDNGYGGSSHINYAPSTDFTHTLLPYVTPVVDTITTNDGNGTLNTSVHEYAGGYHHLADREFRGFSYAKVTGQPDGNGAQTVSETWFHQGNDLAVDVNDPSAANGYLKGAVYRTQVSDGSGNLYTNTETTYTADADGVAPFYTPPASTITDICDGNTCTLSSRMDTVYDAYGNVLQEIEYADINTTVDDRTKVRTYAANTTDWILGLPTSEVIYQGIGTSGTQMTRTDFYYDGTTSCATASTNQSPTKGLLTRSVKWLDGTNDPETRLAYDSYGNAVCARNANGHMTTTAYDSEAMMETSFTDALGQTTTTQYYGVDGVAADNGLYGQVKQVTDPNGAVVSTVYDALGRAVSITQPDGFVSATAYFDLGTVGSQLVYSTNSMNLSSWSYFDGLGRQIKSKGTAPDNKIVVADTEYDQRGKVKRASLPYFEVGGTPLWSSSTFDPMGRVLQVDLPDGTRTLSCYDDNVTVSINANNRRTRVVKDAKGRVLTSSTYAGTYTTCDTSVGTAYSTITHQYDVMGNLRFTTDQLGNVTEMQYDALSRKTSMHDPDMGDWTYAYDGMNNLLNQTDAKGQTIFYQYDAVNRQVQKDYDNIKALGSGDVVYNYDGNTSNRNGRLAQVTDSSGSSTFFYDISGRTTRSEKIIDGTTYTTRTTYDGLGRTTVLYYPDNSFVTYAYNGPELDRVTEGTTTHVAYSGFNANGQAAQVTYGNGVVTDYTYHPQNFRLATMLTAKGGTTLQNMTYGFDSAGNVTGITDPINGNQSFTIDDLGRLTGANGAYGNLTYAYDPLGNMTNNSRHGAYSYNTSGVGSVRPHAVTGVGSNAYSYDANGNMITGAGRAIGYDIENRALNVSVGGVLTSFVYDGDGGRVKKIAGATTTLYIGGHYVCEGASCSRMIFAGDKRIAEIKPTMGANYTHSDHLGSTGVVTDSGGLQVQGIAYYPYGEVFSITGSSSRYKYTGKELDDSTGLYFYSARYYDPVIGKFITADTIVPNPLDPEAFNRYAYANNNPLSYTDPTGHFGFFAAFAIGFAFSATVTAIQGGDFGAILTNGFIGGLAAAAGNGAFTAVQGATASTILAGVAAGVSAALVSSAAYSAAGYDVNIGKNIGLGALAGGITGGIAGIEGINPEALFASKLLVAGGMNELAGGDFATGVAYAAGAMAIGYAVQKIASLGSGADNRQGSSASAKTLKSRGEGNWKPRSCNNCQKYVNDLVTDIKNAGFPTPRNYKFEYIPDLVLQDNIPLLGFTDHIARTIGITSLNWSAKGVLDMNSFVDVTFHEIEHGIGGFRSHSDAFHNSVDNKVSDFKNLPQSGRWR